jgi:hypothetical protein
LIFYFTLSESANAIEPTMKNMTTKLHSVSSRRAALTGGLGGGTLFGGRRSG